MLGLPASEVDQEMLLVTKRDDFFFFFFFVINCLLAWFPIWASASAGILKDLLELISG